jgi:hypothetical protein
LEIGNNKIGNEGVMAIGNGLESNKSLSELNLSKKCNNNYRYEWNKRWWCNSYRECIKE